MADRYLLESGAPDGYLLEDGSGVLLLEALEPITGTGALTAQAAAADGTGTSTTAGTGALGAQPAAADGTGASGSTGTGSPDAQAAATDGTGVSSSAGAGAPAAQSAAVDGEGTSASTGAGALAAQAVQVDGAGASISTGAGVLAAQAATVSGVGEVADSEQQQVGGGIGRIRTRRRKAPKFFAEPLPSFPEMDVVDGGGDVAASSAEVFGYGTVGPSRAQRTLAVLQVC